MNVTREEKKAEAIARLKAIGLYKPTVQQFEKDNIVSLSEPPFGAIYWVDDELAATIKKFEEEYDALVYHVVRSFTHFGKMDSLLYVSDHKDEWNYDFADLGEGYAMTYTINYDMPDFSEFGGIMWELTAAAGMKRVG